MLLLPLLLGTRTGPELDLGIMNAISPLVG